MTRAEQETILRWDEDGHEVIIDAASPVTWRKCAPLGLDALKEHRRRMGASPAGGTGCPSAISGGA